MAYTRTIWEKGDVIDAYKLTNIENGIFGALNQLENLTGVSYDSSKIDKDSLPKKIEIGDNLTAGGNLAVGNHNNISSTTATHNTTDLYTDTVNYGTFTVNGSTNLYNSFAVGTEGEPQNTNLYGPLTVNGTLTINTEPAENSHAATKKYVDDAINSLDVSTINNTPGKTLSKLSEVNGKISAEFQDIEIAENQITNLTTHLSEKAALSGATFTGTVTLASDPEEALHAATKQYIDNITTLSNLSISMDQVRSLQTYLNARALKDSPQITGTADFTGSLIVNGESNFSLITDNEDPNNVVEYYSATINNDSILARTPIMIQNKNNSDLIMSFSYNEISIIQSNIPKSLISYNNGVIVGDNSLQTFILGSSLIIPGDIITTIKTTGNEDGKQGYVYDYNLTTEDRIGSLVLKCNGIDDQSNALLNTPMLLSYQPWGFETGEVLSLGGPAMDAAASDSNCVTDTFIRAKNSITLAPRNGRVNTKSDLSITSGNNLIMYNGTSQVTLSGEQLANLLALLNQSGGE